MIQIEHLYTYGFEAAVRGMRNPMNSWDKSDSHWDPKLDLFMLGNEDYALMQRLVLSGTDHSKFMRMIGISMDILAPLYWWKEFDTYKVGTVANSCSTMHKIASKEFEWTDFSVEHLTNYGAFKGEHGFLEDSALYAHAKIMDLVIRSLNGARERYLDYESRGKGWEVLTKQAWYQMIQLLPSSYNQRRTVMLNYEVAHRQYHARKNHKLDEWQVYREKLETLPYSELITM